MSEERDLARAVVRLTGLLAAGLAAGAGALGRPADAAGLLLGAGLALASFAGLRRGLGHLVAGSQAGSWPGRGRALWVGATGLRLGGIGLVVGLAASQGWIGLPGLVLALALFPFTVVAAGLRAARAA